MKFQKMTYKELENKLLANRCALRKTNNAEEKRRLINENHEIMTELDSRWGK